MKIKKLGTTLKIIPTTQVYAVLEIGDDESETTLHGVFRHREHAEQKALKLKTKHHASGYIAVLRQRVLG